MSNSKLHIQKDIEKIKHTFQHNLKKEKKNIGHLVTSCFTENVDLTDNTSLSSVRNSMLF